MKAVKILASLAVVGVLSACSTISSGVDKTTQAVESVSSAIGDTVNYRCNDKSKMSVRYFTKGKSSLAELKVGKGTYVLSNVPSASGDKYVGEKYQLFGKGSSMTLTDVLRGTAVDCNATN